MLIILNSLIEYGTKIETIGVFFDLELKEVYLKNDDLVYSSNKFFSVILKTRLLSISPYWSGSS